MKTLDIVKLQEGKKPKGGGTSKKEPTDEEFATALSDATGVKLTAKNYISWMKGSDGNFTKALKKYLGKRAYMIAGEGSKTEDGHYVVDGYAQYKLGLINAKHNSGINYRDVDKAIKNK